MKTDVVGFGLKQIKISKLQLPGNWKEILASSEAQERSESIARVGVIHAPVVRKSDLLLICGATRVAALHLRGETEIKVSMVECDDKHVKIMRIDENVERKNLDHEETRKLRATRLEELKGEVLEEDEGRSAHSIKAEATKRLADEAGVKVSTIYQNRARERKRLAANPDGKIAIDLRGMDIDEDHLGELTMVWKTLDTARNQAMSTAKYLDRIQVLSLPFSVPLLAELRDRAETLSRDIAQEMPFSLCPYCRGLHGIVEECNDCNTTGWLPEKEMRNVLPELMDDENPCVLYRTVITKVSEYQGVEEEPDDLEELFG